MQAARALVSCLVFLFMTAVPAAAGALSVDDILAGIEDRYQGFGFSARFHQMSTLEAMDITDEAEGRILIKRPDRMRWEYETPDPQLIVTDGELLWIYRPLDRQVMIGEAPAYFGGGKGAGFLSDVRKVRNNFIVVPEAPEPGRHMLKLIPRQDNYGVESVLLAIDAESFEILSVTTVTRLGDRTRITFSDLTFGLNPDDSLFHFEIPPGTDVLRLGD